MIYSKKIFVKRVDVHFFFCTTSARYKLSL